MTLQRIRDAMDRLEGGYRENDTTAIDAASRELDDLGQAALAIAALPRRKRDAVIILGICCYRAHDLSRAEIAEVLSLPTSVVDQVIDQIYDERRAGDEEDRRRSAESDAQQRALDRSVACPACGVGAGRACRSPSGKLTGSSHAGRVAARGK